MAKAKSKKPVVPTVARMLREIETPKGFEREVSVDPGTEWYPAYTVLKFKSKDIEIVIEFTGGRNDYHLASGHVSFDTSQGRRSYDRHGVEDSFYIDNPLKWVGTKYENDEPIKTTNEKIKNFIEVKIPESRRVIDRSERIPGIPFSVTPERKQEVIRTLKGKKPYTFVPGGFGTGYQLWPKKVAYSHRNLDVEQFFGISPIFITTFDAD